MEEDDDDEADVFVDDAAVLWLVLRFVVDSLAGRGFLACASDSVPDGLRLDPAR